MKKILKFLKIDSMARLYVFGGVAALCVLALSLGLAAGTSEVSGEARKLPIYSVGRDDKVVALSFDAAWGSEQTEGLIATLAEYNVKTTFFVVGAWVDKYPEAVRALHDAGHEVMNHSDSHPHMTKLSRADMLRELNACNDKIQAITGARPKLFRPPYGDYNNALVETVEQAGMYTIQWDVDSLDWKNLTAKQMMDRVIPKIVPGSIVLFHNGGKNTPEVLPTLLKALLDDGYKIVKVSEIIYYDNYVIDHTGKQIPKTAPRG